jgi:hypothetical protein
LCLGGGKGEFDEYYHIISLLYWSWYRVLFGVDLRAALGTFSEIWAEYDRGGDGSEEAQAELNQRKSTPTP